MIPEASDEDLYSVLEKNGWDIERAIPEAVYLQEKGKMDEDAKRRVERDRKRKDEELLQLQKVFGRLNPKIVRDIVEKHEGDIDEATNELIAAVEEEEKTDRERMRILERDRAIDSLLSKFPTLSADQVSSELDKHGGNVTATTKALIDLQIQKFRKTFPSLSEEEIFTIAQANSWNFMETTRALATTVANKKKDSASPAPKPIVAKPAPVAIVPLPEKPVEIAEPKPEIKLEPKSVSIAEERKENLRDLVRTKMPGFISEVEDKKPSADKDDLSKKLAAAPAVPKDASPSDLEIKLEAPERVDVGNKFEVTFEKIKGLKSSTWDWIALCKEGSELSEWVTYQWRPTADKASLVFTAPTEYGTYEFRYMNADKQKIATSNKMIVGPEIELSIAEKDDIINIKWLQKTGNSYPSSWIGFYRKSQKSNEKYIEYHYCKDAIANVLKFKKPKNAGHFEFRFITNGYSHAAATTYVIFGDDKVDASVRSPGNIALKLSLQTVDPLTDNVWVGIYLVTEPRNNYYRRWKKVSKRDEEILFSKGPYTAGIYEARVFANSSYDVVVKSASFEVKGK
eukprot:TRINITY_DN3458_c0_g1_i1.p1 TRINITY_DN3458_c0_g1~~TRINITY_DN3458_c0_g1_i1.p1  ORF type:complete len:632 (+),score=176.66 TRINITY_DN3458_c0_g1_i1:190-1896(+)